MHDGMMSRDEKKQLILLEVRVKLPVSYSYQLRIITIYNNDGDDDDERWQQSMQSSSWTTTIWVMFHSYTLGLPYVCDVRGCTSEINSNNVNWQVRWSELKNSIERKSFSLLFIYQFFIYLIWNCHHYSILLSLWPRQCRCRCFCCW